MKPFKIGIIGGMGPMASNRFYEYLIRHTKVNCDNDHIDLLLSSHATIPDRTTCILNGDEKSVPDAVKSDLKLFEFWGADLIVATCNTFHYFYDEISKNTKIEFLNMVELTLKRISEISDKFVVLGTTGTIKGKVYEKYNQNPNLNMIKLLPEEEELVMDLIYKIKADNRNKSKELEDIIKKYSDLGAISILACTELPLIDLNEELKASTLDPMMVLAETCIKRADRKFI